MTTAQLDKAILNAREILDTRMNGIEAQMASVLSRLDGREHAIDVTVSHLQALVYESLKTQERVSDERFKNVDNQFSGRDTALSAALQAAKEAVGEQNKSFTVSIDKSEKATGEQIGQLRALFDTATIATNDKIAAIQGWQDRREGWAVGQTAQVVETRAVEGDRRLGSAESRQMIQVGIAVLLAVIAVVEFVRAVPIR